MLTMAQNEMDTLESMIDAYDIATVVEALADICSEKADYVQANWQDTAGAAYWDHLARRLYHARSLLRQIKA